MTIDQMIRGVQAGKIKQCEPSVGCLVIFEHAKIAITIVEICKDYVICERLFRGKKTRHKYTSKKNKTFALFCARVYIIKPQN